MSKPFYVQLVAVEKFTNKSSPQYANVSQAAIDMAGVFYNIEQWYHHGLLEVKFALFNSVYTVLN